MSDQYTLDEVAEEINKNSNTVCWSKTPLGEVVDIINGNAFSSDEYTDDGVPLIRISNIGPGTTNEEDIKYLPSEFLNQVDEKFVLKKDDILMAMSGATTGKVSRLPSRHTPALLNQRIAKFETSSELNHHFLLFCLQSHDFQRYVSAFASGGAQDNISSYDLEKISIPFPPLSEQHKIATVLYTIDQAIEKTGEIIEKRKQIRDVTVNTLLSEGYYNHEDIRHRENLELSEGGINTDLDRTSVGGLPDDWEAVRLEDVIRDSLYGVAESAEDYQPEKPRYVRITDISSDGHLKDDKRASLSENKFDEKYFLSSGDILIARSGATVGKTYLYKNGNNNEVYGGYLIRFTPDTNKILPDYLFYYTQSKAYSNWITRVTRKGAQENINAQEYSSILLPLPSLDEQQKIVNILNAYRKSIENENEYKNGLLRLKQGLIQDLLSGTVRTTDTNIEVPDEIAQHG